MADVFEPLSAPKEVDCCQVDIQEIEELGVSLVSNVRDYVMNVDITNIQFDPVHIYEEARKIGLDAGDLSEYGFEKRGKCTNISCLDRNKVKDFSDYLDNMGTFNKRIAEKGQEMIDKAKCHPKLRDSPAVQFVWQLCPGPFAVLGCNPCLNLIILPC